MAGGFSVGGLITGLDANNIIRQLMSIERIPIRRLEARIEKFEKQQEALREFRTQLLSFRNLVRGFQLNNVIAQFQATSTDDTILTAATSGNNPTTGSFVIDVTRLATATVATSSGPLGSPINPAAALNSSGISATVTGNTFSINGVAITLDPNVNSLNDYLTAINGSGAGVTATYDAVTDKVTIVNSTPADTSLINFGASADDSNFLSVIGVDGATQITGGSGSTEVTSTRNLGAVSGGSFLNANNFAGGAVTAGTFQINGVSITIDPATDALFDIVNRINASDAQVTASLDSSTDTIRVVSDVLGSRTISFTSGTSNFLDVTNLTAAIQTVGDDSQFTVDGGPVQTRNSNSVNDAITGVTLNFSSLGTATINIATDNDAIVEDVQEFLDAFNEASTKIRELTKSDGVFQNDITVRGINGILRSKIFEEVTGIQGSFTNLIQIGISTGTGFDAGSESLLELDEEAFLKALADDASGVAELFSNPGKNGIGDAIFDYLDSLTDFKGVLNFRAKSNGSIDQQVRSFRDQIERIERRLVSREARLRAQFTRLEQLSSGFQAQGSFLAGLSSGFRIF